jgi:hypothetical protein
MDIQAGAYVIGNDGKKNWLLQVSSVNDNMVYGHLDNRRAYEPQQGEFSMHQIVAVLGKNPAPGSAYGLVIEPFLRTLEHEFWGNVHLHARLKKEERTSLKKALTDIGRKLTKHKLDGFLQAGNLEVEVRPPKGKYTGMYHYKIKDGENMDRMILRPKTGIPMDYVVAHESGHGVWYRLMTPQQQARWIKMYHSYTKMKDFEPHHIRKLRDSYIEDSVSLRDFRGQLEEAQILLFDNLIGSLCGNTRLTARHLDLLAETGELATIKDVWPTHVEDSDFEIAITEYGTKNPEEFFAESFAYWLLGNNLPKRIASAMEKTIINCKGQ